MYRKLLLGLFFLQQINCFSQIKWINVDSSFGALPKSFHVYKTKDSLDGKPFIAFYAIATLKDKHLKFTTDTTNNRRLTPQQFSQKNNSPLLVVNGTFFSFSTNKNLNVVIKNGHLLANNIHTFSGKGKDTLTYKHPFGSAIGINKNRKADVAWIYADSSYKKVYALQKPQIPIKDSINSFSLKNAFTLTTISSAEKRVSTLKKWKVKTAIGGGPVLIQDGIVKVTNNEELKFEGKAINDMHPRTCMGYTRDGKLIIIVIQGRSANASGASLTKCAEILQKLGCIEALNLDGGGSSCMIINGKETIKPSDKEGERAVPAVFIVQKK